MDAAPRPVRRVTYLFVNDLEGRHRLRARVRMWTIALAVLATLTITHALVDTAVEAGAVERVSVPLGRDFERTFTWETEVNVFAPLGARLWPRVDAAGMPDGVTGHAAMPRVTFEAFADGAPVATWSIAGDVAHFRDTGGMGTCTPTWTCDRPPLMAGWRTVDVTVLVHVENEAQAAGGVYHLTLGPLVVDVDRGPLA